MSPRIRHLRIKIKALAAEARIIRHEERQTRGMEKWLLQEHRRTIVRRTARHNLLAYACLRGMPYARTEHLDSRTLPDWTLIKGLVKRFGGDEKLFEAWLEEAEQARKLYQATKQEVAA